MTPAQVCDLCVSDFAIGTTPTSVPCATAGRNRHAPIPRAHLARSPNTPGVVPAPRAECAAEGRLRPGQTPRQATRILAAALRGTAIQILREPKNRGNTELSEILRDAVIGVLLLLEKNLLLDDGRRLRHRRRPPSTAGILPTVVGVPLIVCAHRRPDNRPPETVAVGRSRLTQRHDLAQRPPRWALRRREVSGCRREHDAHRRLRAALRPTLGSPGESRRLS